MHADTNPNNVSELERFALDELAKRLRFENKVQVLDYPCRKGTFSAVLAAHGAQVLACDQSGMQQEVKGRALSNGQGDSVAFLALPMTVDAELPAGPFDIIVSRHGFAHLPYAEAKVALKRLIKTLKIGGKIFLCTYGLHSELGDAYPAGQSLIEDRFAELEGAIAQRYGISGPVCLYTERNLITLIFEAGGSVLRSFTTTYGTVAAVAVRV